MKNNTAYLTKNVDVMRVTYQIRLLTALAEERGERLVLVLPARAKLSADMRNFVTRNRKVLRIERRPQ